MNKLGNAFYIRQDVIQISKELLGKYIFTRIDNTLTGGMITETEAYSGPEDKASHAYGNRKTERTKVMFYEGGTAYVYLCYGIHSLFNIVTNIEGIPHAVLIRAVEPATGIPSMLKRRKKNKAEPPLTAGPGALSQALGITCRHTGIRLSDNVIWVEDRDETIKEKDIIAGTRVGIAYADEDAKLLWRFRIKNNLWTSTAK